jgi:GNAT superfamily N-acetyltransferase
MVVCVDMLVSSQVRVLSPGDAKNAGSVLATAFLTNPAMVWGLPKDSKRLSQLTWLMTTITRLGCRFNESYAIGAPIQAVAVWLPPNQTDPSLIDLLRVGFARGPFAMGLRDFGALFKVLALFDRMHKEAEPLPHFYLNAVGVEPSRQRQGLGSLVIQPVLTRADAAGLRCYLETDKREDVAFYEKHGFRVRAEFRLPPDGPVGWTMSRAPLYGAQRSSSRR